jgi:hypothetical protein
MKFEDILGRILKEEDAPMASIPTQFQTKDVQASYHGHGATSVSKVNVWWNLEIDPRPWGLKDITITLSALSGIRDTETEEGKVGEPISWDVQDYKVEITFMEGSGLAPTMVDIDDVRRTIEVTFGFGP